MDGPQTNPRAALNIGGLLRSRRRELDMTLDQTASAADLTSMVETFDGASCIHLVTVNEHINRMGIDFSAEAVALNAEIRTIAQRRTNVDLIDWNRIVVEHAADGIMSDDSVHPNEAGVALLATAYADAIESC